MTIGDTSGERSLRKHPTKETKKYAVKQMAIPFEVFVSVSMSFIAASENRQ